MIEATEADKQIANSIMETCQGDYGEEVWIGSGHNAGISLRQEIALALATAREEGRREVLSDVCEVKSDPLGPGYKIAINVSAEYWDALISRESFATELSKKIVRDINKAAQAAKEKTNG